MDMGTSRNLGFLAATWQPDLVSIFGRVTEFVSKSGRVATWQPEFGSLFGWPELMCVFLPLFFLLLFALFP